MHTFRQTLLVGMGALCVLSIPAYSWAEAGAPTTHQLQTPHLSPYTVLLPAAERDSFHQTGMSVQRSGVHQSGTRTLQNIRQSAASNPHTYARKSVCTYTVQPSDTLWSIAEGSRISVSALEKMNRIHSDTIRLGQTLRVPRRWEVYERSLRDRAVQDRASTRQSTAGWTLTREPQRPVAFDIKPLSGVPANLYPIYKGAGSQYGIPWTVLAAIHKTETDFAVSNRQVSSQGAIGPMQFLPATFAEYGVKPPGQHGRPDIDNVCDAVYTAAHMLEQDGFASNPAGAIYAYNHSDQYVQRILALAHLHR